jgi:hypothetical protein
MQEKKKGVTKKEKQGTLDGLTGKAKAPPLVFMHKTYFIQ